MTADELLKTKFKKKVKVIVRNVNMIDKKIISLEIQNEDNEYDWWIVDYETFKETYIAD